MIKATMTIIRIKQVRSRIKCPKCQKRTLYALGLRKNGDVVEHGSTSSILGMIRKVKHLVTVDEGGLTIENK
jgi:large subunit ribosomal protein L30